jgi:hypothetical protein
VFSTGPFLAMTSAKMPYCFLPNKLPTNVTSMTLKGLNNMPVAFKWPKSEALQTVHEWYFCEVSLPLIWLFILYILLQARE